MTTIVTRTTVGNNTGKGSPLTHTEVDTNFVNLNTAKLETAAIPLGTLQAPSVSFLNDSDTGMFCPQGGNSLAIVTGGQYAITCSSTQAVGIKTANPQGALQVAGSTRIGANDATDAFLEIGEGATGNRNAFIDIVADTTYTDYGLRIIRNNTGANATSELKHRGTGALNFTTQEAAPIVFNTTNSPRLTILAGGNVGIGTGSPATTTDIRGAGNTAINSNGNLFVADGGTAVQSAEEGGQISFGAWLNGDLSAPYPVATIKGVTESSTTNINSGALLFGTSNAAATISERMRITSGGNVGIGSSSPSKKLEVAGDIVMTGLDGFGINYAANAGSCFLSRGGVLTSNVQFGGTTSNLDIGSGGGFQINLGKSQCTFNSIPDTANVGQAITLQERMKIDSSGRLLVGTSSSSAEAKFIVQGGATAAGGAVNIQRAATTASDGSTIGFINFTNSSNDVGATISATGAGTWTAGTSHPTNLVFSTTADGAPSPSPRMTITSDGHILGGGMTSLSAGSGIKGFNFENATNNARLNLHANSSAGTASNINFYHSGGQVGGITTTSSATAFNTSSDYRLKENVIAVPDAITRLQQLKPSRFNFKIDPDRIIDGFLAHEVQSVVPEAITGKKDAVDADGNPVYQGIDQSKLVPLLTAALQEAIAKIESLESRLTAAGI